MRILHITCDSVTILFRSSGQIKKSASDQGNKSYQMLLLGRQGIRLLIRNIWLYMYNSSKLSKSGQAYGLQTGLDLGSQFSSTLASQLLMEFRHSIRLISSHLTQTFTQIPCGLYMTLSQRVKLRENCSVEQQNISIASLLPNMY